jgi:hypothetical protein
VFSLEIVTMGVMLVKTTSGCRIAKLDVERLNGVLWQWLPSFPQSGPSISCHARHRRFLGLMQPIPAHGLAGHQKNLSVYC